MQHTDSRVAVLEEQMERLMGNGQPGMIKLIHDRLTNIETRIWWIVIGLAALQVASGGGTLSLKTLLGMLH